MHALTCANRTATRCLTVAINKAKAHNFLFIPLYSSKIVCIRSVIKLGQSNQSTVQFRREDIQMSRNSKPSHENGGASKGGGGGGWKRDQGWGQQKAAGNGTRYDIGMKCGLIHS